MRKSAAMQPAPILAVEFAEGVTLRLSFYAEEGKPINPQKIMDLAEMLAKQELWTRANKNRLDAQQASWLERQALWLERQALWLERLEAAKAMPALHVVWATVSHPSLGSAPLPYGEVLLAAGKKEKAKKVKVCPHCGGVLN